MQNMVTVDLEDWYCTRTMRRAVCRSEWDRCTSRVAVGTERLLRLLDRHGVRATFFVLGYIADREPALVRRIAACGHEIASHGYGHRYLSEVTPEEFACDLDRSIEAIGSAVGIRPIGYRAPGFSILPAIAPWVVSLLRDRGFRYDSSIFPLRGHPDYGFPSDADRPFLLPNGLVEIPISRADIAGLDLPATGGAYFRQAPEALSRLLFDRCSRQGRPIVFYIHPWELDPEMPQVSLPLLSRLRQMRGIARVEERIDRLLGRLPFTSIDNWLRSSPIEREEVDLGYFESRAT